MPDHQSDDDNNAVSRRDFVARTAQAAWAFSALPRIWRGRELLGTSPAHHYPAPELSDAAAALTWRMLGPFRGGRVAAATGVPGRPNEFYMGAVNGGVWKTIDAGRVWRPIFDSVPMASIGAIAVAPSSPDVVYVGSGESTLRDSVGYGDGVYKSIDAGRTWTHLGLRDSQHIGKIAVHPRDPNILFVAAIGHLYASNTERGVFRSTNGGKSWTKVLGDADVGAVEVVIDPVNPRVVYAGLWNTRRPPWFVYAPTNGPGGGIFKSVDGGTTWTRLTAGLPKEGIGRTGIAIAPSNPRRLYAVVDCQLAEPGYVPPPEPPSPTPDVAPRPSFVPKQGGVFRSDDAGATWRRLSGDTALWGRGWYFSKLSVDPHDANTVYVSNVSVSRSMDGGATWVPLRGSPGGDDYHQSWISPDDTNTMIVASDQGAIVTRNARAADPRTVTWSSWLNQPTAQLYHISVDYRTPYWVTGAQQDSGAVAVRSRGKFASISTHDWEPIGPGGESGYTAGDRRHPGIVFGGTGERWDLERNVQLRGTIAPKGPEKDRADWTQPLVFSAADPSALYYGSQYLFRTTDDARTWTRISGDLTRPDPGVPSNLDATAAAATDRNGKRGVIYTIAPSPLQPQTIWIGTDDGLIQRTTDGGNSWRDVTPPAITAWSRITTIEASYFDANTAYASVDRHQLQDFDPYIYRTRDGGRSWQPIVNGLPRGVYVHCVREDPRRQGLLFAGTERAVWVSFDDGDRWQPLQRNLPVTSMRDLQIHENDLILGTHGRGIWVIDDISPLRQVTGEVLRTDVHLFQPAEIVNYDEGTDNGTPLQKDEPQTPNPPNGAAIDFWIGPSVSGPVTLEIADAGGAVIRRWTSVQDPIALRAAADSLAKRKAERREIPQTTVLWREPAPAFSGAPGMHRVVWNPVSGGAPEIDGTNANAPRLSGTFQVRLTAGGRQLTRQLIVKPDPASTP